MNKPLVFTLGAAVGAVAALLLSPNSGERNREIVADKVDYYTAHGEQVFQQTADTVRNKVRGVADVATNADADDIREKINEARDRIAEQITRNSSVPQDVAADVSDVAADAAESVSEAADTAADAAEGAAKAAADAVKSK
ncbi:MAG TPA: YtxH domain-containing protein [Coriobacteriaceae bacterium]|nr:YtxH domain-containing protein [Coriobacteriaceae bacterium]